MPLTSCQTCHAPIDASAPACPHCGRVSTRSDGSKAAIAAICFALALSIAGFGIMSGKDSTLAAGLTVGAVFVALGFAVLAKSVT